jgi:adenylate cyclase
VDAPLKRRVRLVFAITGLWLVVALFMWVYDVLFLLSLPRDALIGTDILGREGLRSTFETSLLGALLGGLLGGGAIAFFLRDRIRHLPMAAVLTIHSATYVVIIVLVSAFVSGFYLMRAHSVAPWQPEVRRGVATFLASAAFLRVLVLLSATAGLTSILLEVNDKYGPGVLKDFLLGRYHRPKVEERFFMFLDLRGSTTIAERLGHVRYFNFLSDFVAHATDPILSHEGQIHEYVGDEIVVSWLPAHGARDANCLACFFDLRRSIEGAAPQWKDRYGIVPDFKAGVHFGSVTTGEIGVVKKEIVFSGDVLNTTARIQERCNAHQVDLLVSEEALGQLNGVRVEAKPVEEVELRGKARPITLYAVERLTGRAAR